MRKSSLALLLAFGVAATFGSSQPVWSQTTDLHPVLESADQSFGAISKSRAGRIRTSAASDPDTVWIGHVIGNTGLPGVAGGYGPYHVGRGLNLAGNNSSNATRSGTWDFDTFNAGETDSLQGWWPLNRGIGTTGGASVNDKERPFHGLDYGNQGNYVMSAVGASQKRTFGVIGYWHRDPGFNSPGLPDIGGVVPGPDVEWAPISGGFSAWCGLRGHNDTTVQDPITGNYFNQNVLDRMGTMAPTVLGGAVSALGTDMNMPGYGSCWDQMMYRDVVLETDATPLTLSFNYRTDMSTIVHTAVATRIGWFDKDPVKTATLNDGNFVSSTDAGANAPADSFMVYIGVPVEPVVGDDNDFKCSDPTAGANGDGMLEIFDVQRRWFSEVVAIDKPYRQLLSKGGLTPVTAFSVVNLDVSSILAAQPGAGGTVRVIFRVKTNRGGDDMDLTQSGFSSGTAGAAIVDDVVANGNTIGNFEGAGSIDNNPATPATSAWKTTGKPPGVYFHAHDLNDGLVYLDQCGTPGAPSRQCNMIGKVISAGDHDMQEKLGGVFVSATSGNYKDRHSWFGSPTINLMSTGDGAYNAMGIDTEIADATEYRLLADIYTGGVKGNSNGNFFQFGWSSYPSRQQNNLNVWGEIRTPPVISFFNQTFCVQTISRNARTDANLVTTNANGIPDSVRVYIQHVNRCFAIPSLNAGTCSPTTGLNAGLYFDNLALALIDAEPPPTISFNIWDLYQDAFPGNGNPSLLTTPLGAGTAFDTAAAQVRQGLNIAQNTGATINRFNIPGDSLVFTAGDVHRPPAPQGNQPTRVDLVFRILPGVGNYVQTGNKASGLKRSPDAATAATSGDASFWGQYLASNGQFGTPGGHSGGVWSQHVWNSARCDSAERNLFRAQGHSNNLNQLTAGLWAGMYHESDPKFATLGIVKNRCFLINNAAGAPNNATNTTCSSVPAWASAPGSGFDPAENPAGPGRTLEYTKILPDGQLTPGAHVQYFVRKSIVGDLVNSEVQPDTQKVATQGSEGSTDGHRWQQFGVLPDRWKSFEGPGPACMLFIDGNDRRGDERFFVSAMDSIGGTSLTKRGAHNGWSAPGNFDWTPNGGNPNIASQPWSVAAHGGQPGTTWDMFGMKASESGTTVGSVASRSAGGLQPLGLAAGKLANYGPTGDMLRRFYKVIFYTSGDLGSAGSPLIGPYPNKSDDDVAMFNDFANISDGLPQPRGVWFMGRSFAESQSNVSTGHPTWLVNYLGANTTGTGGSVNYYLEVSPVVAPDLIPQAAIGGNGQIYGVASTCLIDDDVLSINTGLTGAVASSYYQNAGIGTDPQEAGVYVPVGPGHPHISLLDGFRIQSIGSRYTLARAGLLSYMVNTYNAAFGALCPLVPGAPLGIGDGPAPFVSFLNLRSANPMRSGEALIAFGIKSTEKVEVKVYDVTGRLVKTVANRTFQGGMEHVVTWDGTNDAGQSVARGVYFYQLRSPSFVSQKKLTVLKN